jgi:plasmid stabilization system protein ParE
MPHEVILTDRAIRDLNDATRYISRHAPETAEKWRRDFLESLLTLENNPHAYSLAEESKEFPFELRQYFYRTRSRRLNRALFVVLENQVRILAIRRPGQEAVGPHDLR